jgi:hypothetical protein
MANGLATDFAGAGIALGGLASLAGVYVYGRKTALRRDSQAEK